MTRGSLQIIKLFGIPVYLHWSFLLVILFLGYYGISNGLSAGEITWTLFFSSLLFLSILLHEFGHALTARRFNVKTKDIILLPIGGLARLNKLPDKPIQEMLVALAGPFINFIIALILIPYFLMVTMPGLEEHELSNPQDLIGDYFYLLPLLAFVNLLLAVFNLIPAFPMDGGRILRAMLSLKLERLKATKIAVVIGQIIAAGMIGVGIWRNEISYSLLGAFIYFTAGREYKWALTEDLLKKHQVGEVYKRNHTKLFLDDDINAVVNAATNSDDNNFLVFNDDDKLVGTLSFDKSVFKHNDTVANHYQPIDQCIEVSSSLKKANEIMQSFEHIVIPVVEEGKPVGWLENEMIWRFLSEREKSNNF